jgi:hypothetical protein
MLRWSWRLFLLEYRIFDGLDSDGGMHGDEARRGFTHLALGDGDGIFSGSVVDAWSLQLISFYMGGDVSIYLSI